MDTTKIEQAIRVWDDAMTTVEITITVTVPTADIEAYRALDAREGEGEDVTEALEAADENLYEYALDAFNSQVGGANVALAAWI